MSQHNLNTSVGDWVVRHPATARVFESHHIDYCCGGGKSLEQACLEKQIDSGQLAAELQRVLDDRESGDEQEARDWSQAPLAELCDHIERTHHAYLRSELPRLAELITKVVKAHGEAHPELTAVQRLFSELRAELEPHMFKEERVLFPAIRQLEQAAAAPSFPFGTVADPIRVMEHEHDNAGSALAQLRELTGGYTIPEGACNTYRAMLNALQQLEADMHQHVHKENNILFPRALKLESDQSHG